MSDTWLPNPSRGPATREPQYVSHKQDERRDRLSQDRTDPLMPSPTFHSGESLRFPSHIARGGPTTGYPPDVRRTSYDDGLDDFGMYCTVPIIVALLTQPRQEYSRGHHAAAQLRRRRKAIPSSTRLSHPRPRPTHCKQPPWLRQPCHDTFRVRGLHVPPTFSIQPRHLRPQPGAAGHGE